MKASGPFSLDPNKLALLHQQSETTLPRLFSNLICHYSDCRRSYNERTPRLSYNDHRIMYRTHAVVLVLGYSISVIAGCQYASHGQNAEGVRLYQQAYYQGALQRFQQAVQTDPQNADGYYNVAATYHQIGKLHKKPNDLTQAESYYHQCLDRNPNHQDCHRALAVLLIEQNRSKDAFRLLEGWAERNPSAAAPRLELARLFDEQGNKEAAKQHLIDAIAVDPNNARALAALGKIREEAGDAQQALANYQRSLSLDRFQPQVAARVASLQGATATAPIVTPPGGTRTVSAPVPQARYY